AAVELGEHGAEAGLEARAGRCGEAAGGGGVADEGVVGFGHITSQLLDMTNYVTISTIDWKCQ
ncbi:MAG: hypothetical protein ACREKB_01305, partial [Candidatus Rokuibacteriota bacterium]